MPYRKVFVGAEEFIARITDQALDEWLENRERLRRIGYPDRPPDVDTPLTRSWILHPDEKMGAYMLPPGTIKETFPVYTLSFQSHMLERQEHKLLVAYSNPEEKYIVRMVVRNSLTGETIADNESQFTHDEIVTTLDLILEMYAKFIVTSSDECYITTYDDYAEIEKETELAEKELEDYFGKPRVN